MLTDEDQRACRVLGMGVAQRALKLEAGLIQAVPALRLATTQSAVAHAEFDRSGSSLRLVERAASAMGCDSGSAFKPSGN